MAFPGSATVPVASVGVPPAVPLPQVAYPHGIFFCFSLRAGAICRARRTAVRPGRSRSPSQCGHDRHRMKLPDYFLADLPPEAVLTPAMIEEACQTLKRNRERYLAGRPTTALIRLLSETAESWLQPDFPFRKFALEQGPKATGFSSATLASGLDAFFRQLTAENLRALLVQELGHAQRLDAMSATSVEQAARRAALVNG